MIDPQEPFPEDPLPEISEDFSRQIAMNALEDVAQDKQNSPADRAYAAAQLEYLIHNTENEYSYMGHFHVHRFSIGIYLIFMLLIVIILIKL